MISLAVLNLGKTCDAIDVEATPMLTPFHLTCYSASDSSASLAQQLPTALMPTAC